MKPEKTVIIKGASIHIEKPKPRIKKNEEGNYIAFWQNSPENGGHVFEVESKDRQKAIMEWYKLYGGGG